MTTRRVESPCIRHCTLDPDTDICIGCYRTIDEILKWSKYSNQQRLAVIEKLGPRKQNYAQIRQEARAKKNSG